MNRFKDLINSIIKKLNSLPCCLKDKYNYFKRYKTIKCPNCSFKICALRYKKEISIKCPKCRIEFNKKT